MKGEIEVRVKISQHTDITLDVEDVVSAANELPVTRRWNLIACLLNYIDTNEEELTPEQKDITVKWLQKKLHKFNA